MALVRLLEVPGLPEAEMWRTLLAQEGIVALLTQPHNAGLELGPHSLCHVLVPACDAQRAADLLAAWSADAPLDEAATQEQYGRVSRPQSGTRPRA